MIEKAHKTLRNFHEWSGTVRNGERSGTVNGQERNGHEHLGTIGAERSNALERIVENGHGTVTLMFQIRKKHCKNIFRRIQMRQYERHTQRVSASYVDFLKAHIKNSFSFNFEKFWISLL